MLIDGFGYVAAILRASRTSARRRRLVTGASLLLVASACGAGAGSALAGPYPGIPDPGGDPDAIVAVPPPPGKFFGYLDNSADRTGHGWSAAELAQVAREGGANLHRFSISWWAVEPSRDRWNEDAWARYGRVYDALLANGIRPLITLGGVPEWARPVLLRGCGLRRGCEYPPARWATDQWGEFAAEVARRFPQTAAIEIWNEPNSRDFWKPLPNPHRFAALVAASYPAIKAVNPNVRVLAGGLAPIQARGGNLVERLLALLGQTAQVPMRDFLAAAYRARQGIKHNMDGISFHTTFNTTDYGAESLWAKAFWDARSTAQANGDAGIELWLSETGLTTTGPLAYDEETQADGLIRQYRRVMAMPDLKAMVVHTLGDQVAFPARDPGRGYGVIRSWNPLGPKLVYCAFAELATQQPAGC